MADFSRFDIASILIEKSGVFIRFRYSNIYFPLFLIFSPVAGNKGHRNQLSLVYF